MKTIYKYELKTIYEQTIRMPIGFKVLSAGVQNDTIYIQAIVDRNSTEYVDVSFAVIGTGDTFWCEGYGFIGTVFTHQQELAWHVFFSDDED